MVGSFSEPVATPIDLPTDLQSPTVDSSSSVSSTVGTGFAVGAVAGGLPQAKAVLRQHGGPSQSKISSKSTDEPPADPATCPVRPGSETTIEINKDKIGLGLSIVGGSDTLLVYNKMRRWALALTRLFVYIFVSPFYPYLVVRVPF